MSKCEKELGNIKSIHVINQSDMVYEDGKLRMKKKYGKFKREVYNLDLEKKLNKKNETNL
jgi:hypothetical protein